MKKFLKTVAMMMALVMVIDTPVSAANLAELGEDRASGTIFSLVEEPGSGTVVGGTNDGTDDGSDDGDDWGSLDGKDKVPGQVLAVAVQDGTTRNVEKGDRETITVDVITNGDLVKKAVKFKMDWTVSGDAVKLVSKTSTTCTFEAVKGGQATITATAGNKVSSQSASVTVNVTEYADKISFKQPSYTQYTKQKIDMSKELDKDPKSASDKIYYQIDNTKIASVDANGVVTMKNSEGTFNLTASTERGKSATTKITVAKGKPVKKIILKEKGQSQDLKSLTMEFGKNKTIEISSVDPADTTDTFEWTSAKTNFVKITPAADKKSAEVEAVGVGTSTITVKASSGKKVNVKITVNPNMAGMSVVDVDGNTLGNAYPKMKLTLTVKPADEFISSKNTGSFQWTSDNTKVATVSGKGVVTVKGQDGDTVHITAKDKKSSNSASYTLTIVKSTIEGLDKVSGEDTLDVGCQAQYGALYKDAVVDINQISWSVSGSSMKIDDNGRATAVKAGKATVKATVVTSAGKSITKTLKVTVNQPVLEASFKTPVIVVAPNKQKAVSFKLVVGPKGAKVKNNGDVKYEIIQGNNIAKFAKEADAKKGKVTVDRAAKAGDEIIVKATMPSGISTTGRIFVAEKGKFDLNVFKQNLAADNLDGKFDVRKKTLTLDQGESLELETYLTVSNTDSKDNSIQTHYTYTLPKNNTAVAIADGTIYGLLSTGNKTVSVKVKAVGGATTTIKVKVNGQSVAGGTHPGDDKNSHLGDDKNSHPGDDKKANDGNDKM
ncbi:MAG: Ig-like domain-containing protein [Acetatifactor sp.]|nr:Ig-like domain-containing protein [Acetatifactor sp.]